MNEKLVSDIWLYAGDPLWVEENSQEIYEIMKKHLSEQYELLIDPLLAFLPYVLQREDVKRWGDLLEEAYSLDYVKETDGLDGDKTYLDTGIYIYKKQAPPKQLPTKTVRRKRLLKHPTQTMASYTILFMKRFYHRAADLSTNMIRNLIHVGHIINSPHQMNKAYQALAYIYNKRGEGHHAIELGEISYHYWQDDALQAGLSAYAIAEGYCNLMDFAQAREWADIAIDAFEQAEACIQLRAAQGLLTGEYA